MEQPSSQSKTMAQVLERLGAASSSGGSSGSDSKQHKPPRRPSLASTIGAGLARGNSTGSGRRHERRSSQGGGSPPSNGPRSLLGLSVGGLASEVIFNDQPQPPTKPNFLRRVGSGVMLSDSFTRQEANDMQRQVQQANRHHHHRRRHTDDHRHRRRGSGLNHTAHPCGGGSSSGDGLFGISFRRMSLDQQLHIQAQLDSSYREHSSASISNYQEVFKQLKTENPTSSVGALHQMTMAKMAEINYELREEEARLKKSRHRKEEEERLRNRTAAREYVDKWVGKMQRSGSDSSITKYTRSESNSSYQSHCNGNNGNVNESFHHSNTATTINTSSHTASSSVPFIPTKSISMLRRQSSDLLGPRRASTDSSLISGVIQSIGDTNHSNYSSLRETNHSLDDVMNSQAENNFAPRRSVGSMAAPSSDDLSLESSSSTSGNDGRSVSDILFGSDAEGGGGDDDEEEEDDDNLIVGFGNRTDRLNNQSRRRSTTDRMSSSERNADYDGLIVGFGDRSSRSCDRREENRPGAFSRSLDRRDNNRPGAFSISRLVNGG